MSCQSVSNTSFASCDSQEDLASLPQNGKGFFSFLVNAASRCVSWVMYRPIHVQLKKSCVVWPCDSHSDVGFEITVSGIMVKIEPTLEAGAELMKVIVITFSGVAVCANAVKEQPQKIVEIDHLSMRITSVYSAAGILCRKNVAIVFDGVSSLFFDEDALRSLTRCAVSHGIMKKVPEYCRPFYKLRSLSSRWSYAKSFVFAFIRDRRRRYNFNSSHLHFYAEARTSYLALLDYCHRTRDIAEKREQLADIEGDIRYRDVVLFFEAQGSREILHDGTCWLYRGGCDTAPTQPSDAREFVIVSSLHVDAKITCVRLPAETTVWLRDVAFVKRHGESNFSVGNVTLVAGGMSQLLRAPDSGEPFFSLQQTESNGMTFVRTTLEELRFITTSNWILQLVQPIMVAMPHVLRVIPENKL
ncbi:hypothetical protein C4B63_24g340 [Trypanosoma cruzi]|uniref:Uncharacterized protein n=1 Tax=Trypanosoma cruzi TaxID=5693 RepID=A0A2V2VEB7_TRYCR|nr:hypothetical protein C4B63_24g340 [Trypanosoma cruzi]